MAVFDAERHRLIDITFAQIRRRGQKRIPSANPVNVADPQAGDDRDSVGVVASAAGGGADAVPVSCFASVAAVAAAVRVVGDETIAGAVVDVPALPAVTGGNGGSVHG